MGNELYIKGFSLSRFLRYHFVERKLNTQFGYCFLALVALGLSFEIATFSSFVAPISLAVAVGFLIFIAMMKWPYFGFYFLLVFSSCTIVIDRILNLPVPSWILVDVFTYYGLLSILLKYNLKNNIDRRFYTHPITVAMYVLFFYYIIELFNPEMYSGLGWASFFKKQVSYFVFYYMCYCLLDSKAKIIFLVRFMIGLSTILALYACKQQWFGYAGFELRSIGTGEGYSLLMQGGLLRKFSVFSDPAASGICFASIVMLCIILIFRGQNKKERQWLSVAMIVNLLGYSYSGTRTATLMIVSGILLYCLSVIFERRTVNFLLCAVGLFVLLMVFPYQNVVTNRIRSTFAGTNDASASIRDYDRHQVQPYIQAHPMGGGIFTVGVEGMKYNQGHYLEFLQADSGYMKTLGEQGPIGLALLLIFYFVVMRVGFRNFYRVQDPEIRTYYIGLLVMMFTLLVGQYSQMAISQYPTVLYFYAIMVIFIKLADFDQSAQPLKTIQI
jgi:putative inorganic carbon (hco3(-)) transporter